MLFRSVKFSEAVGVNQIYEVNLMSFSRDLSSVNWMKRYQDNYEAEAYFYSDKIYLILTKVGDLFIEVINPEDGTISAQAHHILSNPLIKFWYPQMTISNRFESIYLVYQIQKINPLSVVANDKELNVVIFSPTTLAIKSESISLKKLSTATGVSISQTLDKEQIIIKGILDGIVDNNENRFTLSMHPVVSNQDFGSTCFSHTYQTFTTGSITPAVVDEATLTGILSNTLTSIRWDSSGITYVASPATLSPTSICTINEMIPKEKIVNSTTVFRVRGDVKITVETSDTNPSGQTLTYEVVQPTEYSTTITKNSTHVVFEIKNEYELNEQFILEYRAKFNSTMFTTNTYTVTAICREE